MNPRESTVRCAQCGWSIGPNRLDDVWLDGELVPLHKGGCPRGDPPPPRKRA